MKYATLCSGIEAPSVAWHGLGFEPVAFSEVAPFPSRVLAHRFPDVPNLGDMTAYDTWNLPHFDLLFAGVPCFTAGHMVLTETGYRAIETLRVGDLVVTHEGRLQPILRTGSEIKATGILSGVGLPHGIRCTPDHPFLTRAYLPRWTTERGKAKRVQGFGEPTWKPASEMVGSWWVALTSYHLASFELPEFRGLDRVSLMRLAGMYLGDGWTNRPEGIVLMALNGAKYAQFREWFPTLKHGVGDRVGKVAMVRICNGALAAWLVDQFGHGAANKRLPSWVLGHPLRLHLFEGYRTTDGNMRNGVFTANSISKALSFGMRDLLQTLGYLGFVSSVRTSDTKVIEGRTVNQQDYWSLRALKHGPRSRGHRHENHLIRQVEAFTPDAVHTTVYNIEVANDHSYILDGAVVHNCQDFSQIGPRDGVAGARGALTLSFVLAARKWNPRWVGFENVPGILSSRDNAFGQLLAGLCGEDSALPLPGSRWPDAGVVSGPERVVAWRVLDAQYFGSPQTRRRVFLLASRGPRNFASAAALFPVGEGLPGRPPARPRTYPHHRPHLPGGAGARGLVPSTGDLSHCLNAGGMGRIDLETESMVAEFRDGRPHGVRMLTPLECERIQGLPEGWTDVPGAPVPDSARYRAVGNAIAVPVLEWLGRRLQAVDSSFAF